MDIEITTRGSSQHERTGSPGPELWGVHAEDHVMVLVDFLRYLFYLAPRAHKFAACASTAKKPSVGVTSSAFSLPNINLNLSLDPILLFNTAWSVGTTPRSQGTAEDGMFIRNGAGFDRVHSSWLTASTWNNYATVASFDSPPACADYQSGVAASPVTRQAGQPWTLGIPDACDSQSVSGLPPQSSPLVP